jgi:NADPH:quinone reductase
MMKTARVDVFGGPDVLQIVEQPIPEPREHEVLVRVAACGLNYSDLLQREGVYPGGPKPPFFPGVEAAGIVEAAGSEASTDMPVGARIACVTRGGAHAEFLLATRENCVPLPDSVSFPEGAGFLVQYLTAFHALVTAGHAREGETVLIHAAAGGVGTAAVQIARLIGLRVIGTASTAEKCERILKLGADRAVVYGEFADVAREMTHGRGPDLILDTIGGDILRRSLRLLPPLGRLIVAGIASREAPAIDSARLLFRSQSVTGFHLSSIFERQDLLRESSTTLLGWVGSGRIKVQIGHAFPLADIRKAHELLSSRNSYGKVILLPHTET